ncbi:hypothetical protein E2562_021845 [Oryza meyeriana var. granulata]|uniref:Uncharacterized protein n=1 Tax=Oryza meyeriana var. granulata TaxID=110450 RepID=A0A6G1ENE1_9ORYZ|nr:hypothetical protein E2562_021845 [Oryza meyeriana var. granulata]
MLKVVVSVSDVATSILPREDLALCNDRGRVALQETLPKCDARGIQERASGMVPRSVRIPGDGDDEACQDSGVAQASGASTEESVVNPWDSKRTSKRPQIPSPPRSQKPHPPPSPPQVSTPRRLAHDTEAGGSSRP